MRSMEKIISESLRWGVLVSAVIIGLGLAMYLVTGNSGYTQDIFPTGFTEILIGVSALKSFAIIDFGLILLILTPVIRVIVSIIGSIQEKDKAYIFINTYVLLILVISLLLGKAE